MLVLLTKPIWTVANELQELCKKSDVFNTAVAKIRLPRRTKLSTGNKLNDRQPQVGQAILSCRNSISRRCRRFFKTSKPANIIADPASNRN